MQTLNFCLGFISFIVLIKMWNYIKIHDLAVTSGTGNYAMVLSTICRLRILYLWEI